MIEQIQRRDAAQAVLDRFNGRAFAWGTDDCVRLAAFALRQLGHKVSLAKAGSYSSQAGAIRALKRAGFDGLEQAVDAQGLLRIPPAAARPCDLVALPGLGGWPALTVALGNGRVLGFHGDVARVLKPLDLVTAWNVSPCLKS